MVFLVNLFVNLFVSFWEFKKFGLVWFGLLCVALLCFALVWFVLFCFLSFCVRLCVNVLMWVALKNCKWNCSDSVNSSGFCSRTFFGKRLQLLCWIYGRTWRRNIQKSADVLPRYWEIHGQEGAKHFCKSFTIEGHWFLQSPGLWFGYEVFMPLKCCFPPTFKPFEKVNRRKT